MSVDTTILLQADDKCCLCHENPKNLLGRRLFGHTYHDSQEDVAKIHMICQPCFKDYAKFQIKWLNHLKCPGCTLEGRASNLQVFSSDGATATIIDPNGSDVDIEIKDLLSDIEKNERIISLNTPEALEAQRQRIRRQEQREQEAMQIRAHFPKRALIVTTLVVVLLGSMIHLMKLYQPRNHTPPAQPIGNWRSKTIANPMMQRGMSLMLSAERGKVKSIEALLAEGSITEEDRGWALVAASENGHLEAVKILLRDGQITPAYQTAAMGNALKNGHQSIADFIRDF